MGKIVVMKTLRYGNKTEEEININLDLIPFNKYAFENKARLDNRGDVPTCETESEGHFE